MSGLSKALTRVAKFMVVKDARYLTGQPPAAVRSFSYPTREKPDTWSDLGRSSCEHGDGAGGLLSLRLSLRRFFFSSDRIEESVKSAHTFQEDVGPSLRVADGSGQESKNRGGRYGRMLYVLEVKLVRRRRGG